MEVAVKKERAVASWTKREGAILVKSDSNCDVYRKARDRTQIIYTEKRLIK